MDKRFGLKKHCIEDIMNVLKLQPEVEEALIFGSRAMGTYKNGSDIDIALKGKKINFDTISTIRLRLDELTYAYMYDVIDYKKISNPAVKAHIDELGIVFYKKEQTPNGWKIYKLGDLVDPKRGITYGVVQPGKFLKDGGVPILKVNNLTERKYSLKDASKISVDVESKYERSRLIGNEILVSLVGSLGYIYKVRKELIGWNVVRAIGVLPIKEEFDKDWIYWFIKSPDIQREFLSHANTTVQATLNLKELRDIEIKYPENKTREVITSILSSLDDKIELNLQMNQTLEEMAQALFKEWFVNFNFPGFDGELENGLPKGWEKIPIDKSIDFLNGIALQKYPAVSESTYLPVIKIRELKQGITESSDKASLDIPEQYIINDGDVLFSWSGSLEVEIWCGGTGALNQHLFKVSSDKFPKWFYYLWTRHHLPIYKSIAEGKVTTMGHIQRRHLTETLITVPDKELFKKTNEIISPLIEKLILNRIEIKTLSQTRDSLLPKLMAGKIEVK